jgi:amino acid adenylation domain-containing protein
MIAFYDAGQKGQQPALAELPIQYADYAIWQRQWLSSGILETQLSYWRAQLANCLPVLELPTDRPRPAIRTSAGAQQRFTLPPHLTRTLRELSRREGATLFMTLLAAFKVLLSRYTNQSDINVGTPVAGRLCKEVEPLIGLFTNTLVMRTRFADDPTFADLLARVREVALGAYAHQDLPFGKLVEELQPERSMGHSPLFQVMFILQNAPVPSAPPDGLDIHPVAVDSETAKFDLSLSMAEDGDELAGAMEYSTDLFDAGMISRMIAHFQNLLAGVVSDLRQRILSLPMLSEAEQRMLIVEWNATSPSDLSDHCMNELFEAQAARTPDATAVVWGDDFLSYGELNLRADRIARHLRALNVGPEVRVGICLRRSLEMVVGLLGILKAGGAYVPLDPAYPQERLGFILEDSQVSVLLSQTELADRLPGHNAQAIYLNADWPAISDARQSNDHEVTADNLAYVIYTSGSTGKPKGVAIKHRNAVTFLNWAKGVFSPEQVSGLLASTSICFDLSVFELFFPLSVGGTIILAENALQVPELSAAGQITLINTVPAAMSELLRMGELPRAARTINLAGEPLSKALAQQLYENDGVEAVFNLYGPSEDTTYSTYSLVVKGSALAPSIGRPIAHSQAYIVDERMQPVPVGVPGELYLGGAGLARGYLNRPHLTAERFVPNPFAAVPGERLYKTGDLTRYRSDGEIEFLGRIDHQIKLRGFRIEIGEIEAILNQHPRVQETAVGVYENKPGDPRLAAYVVVQDEAGAALDELRRFLAEKLPEHMIPSAFVTIKALPLTPNGKIDRRALAALNVLQPDPQRDYVAPRTAEEKTLAGIWTDILGVGRVGVNDNFYALGGHSLLATQVVSRVRQVLEVDLPLRRFLEAPTVAELASFIERHRVAARVEPRSEIRPRPRGKKDFRQLLVELDRLSKEDASDWQSK